MSSEGIYAVGGAVQASGGIYLVRQADGELLHLCREGQFAYVLAPRQVGKSSLMIRTSQELAKYNIRSAVVDLSLIGVNNTRDQWYCSILAMISHALELKSDVAAWWAAQSQLTETHRLSLFFKDVLLEQVRERVVIFVDEIDTTIDIPFADDFYAAIRSIYNARPSSQSFERLSFVLIGTASPSDLIRDSQRTPFNIGQRVDLRDFSFDEVLPFAQGLDESLAHGRQVLKWILDWTGGHPYLTQKLCAILAHKGRPIQKQDVADSVSQLFLGEQGKRDDNLHLVQAKLLSHPRRKELIRLYQKILEGEQIPENVQAIQNQLSLIGLVKAEDGFLAIRNQIYETAFDLEWVMANTPQIWKQILRIGVTLLVSALALLAVYTSTRDAYVDREIDRDIAAFYSSATSSQRLASLAAIFRARGILRNKDTTWQAQELFFTLDRGQQRQLFSGLSPRDESNLTTVIEGLYVTFADVDESGASDELLKAMYTSLERVTSDEALNLHSEIDFWLKARGVLEDPSGNGSLENYSQAIIIAQDQNPATLFERARVRITVGDNDAALIDLNKIAAIAKELPRERGVPSASGPGYRSDFGTYEGMTAAIRLLVVGEVALQRTFYTHPNRYALLSESGFVPAPPTPTVPLPTLTSVATELMSSPTSTNVPIETTPSVLPNLVIGGAQKIALTSNNEIYLMNIDGSDFQPLTHTGEPKFDLQWLPRSNQLLYVQGNCVYRIAVDSARKEPEQLTCFTDPKFSGFRVSPDGKQVAISIADRLLVVSFDLQVLSIVSSSFELQGLESLCLDYGEVSVKGALWSPDGQRLAIRYQSVVNQRIGDTIRVIGGNWERCQQVEPLILDEFPANRFVPEGYERYPVLPSFGWDGQRFLFNTFQRNRSYGNLYLYDMSTEIARKIDPIESVCCYGSAAFSPDGTYVLLVFQDVRLGAGSKTLLYYIPIDQIDTGVKFPPIRLPDVFFDDRRENIQLALQPGSVTPLSTPSPIPVSKLVALLTANKTSGRAPLIVKLDARDAYLTDFDGQRHVCRDGACHYTWKVYSNGQQIGKSVTDSRGTFEYQFGRKGIYTVTVWTCRGQDRLDCGGSAVQIVVS